MQVGDLVSLRDIYDHMDPAIIGNTGLIIGEEKLEYSFHKWIVLTASGTFRFSSDFLEVIK
jgi:hypothetical protein